MTRLRTGHGRDQLQFTDEMGVAGDPLGLRPPCNWFTGQKWLHSDPSRFSTQEVEQ